MELDAIKEKMLAFTDFYGCDIMYEQEIKEATTKKELKKICNDYYTHMEMRENDALRHFDSFVNQLKLEDE